MAKITLSTLSSGYQSTTNLNDNFTSIQNELNNKVLYRNPPVGETNSMQVDLDLNGFKAINGADGTNNSDYITLRQLNNSLSAAGSGLIASLFETQKGSAAVSRVFTLSGITYSPGSNNLLVFRNGQKLTRIRDYTETDTNRITLTFDPSTDDDFDFITNASTTSNVNDAQNVSYNSPATGALTRSVADYLDGMAVTPQMFGAVGDGVTDDTAALQKMCDRISAVGGGKITFPESSGDWIISGEISFSAPVGVVIEFGDTSNSLKLTSPTSGGGIIEFQDGSNVVFINPRINANNVIGQNGIGVGSNCRLEVIGGYLQNFPVALDYTGGKPIGMDGGGSNVSITGTKFYNCHSAIHLKRDLVTDPSSEPLVVTVSDVIAEDCDMFIYTGITNSTTNDGTLFDVSVSNFNTIDCGLIGGVFVFNRASNVKITNGSISATSSYNTSTPIASIFRGRGRKLFIDAVQINQSADAIIDIDPLPNYATDTSLMADNRYGFVATGTYDYLFKSDLTDSTHPNRYLDNTYIDATLSNDVTTKLVTPATRNGSTFLTIRSNGKYLFEQAAEINGVYDQISDIQTYSYFRGITGTWTPTISASSGTITTISNVSGRYEKVGNEVTLYLKFEITDNGTGSGYISFTTSGLPSTVTPPSQGLTGTYTENAIGPSFGYIYNPGAGGNPLYMFKHDGTYPGSTGGKYSCAIHYNMSV